MWPNLQFPADLGKFTEEILMENFIFCAVFFLGFQVSKYFYFNFILTRGVVRIPENI